MNLNLLNKLNKKKQNLILKIDYGVQAGLQGDTIPKPARMPD